MGDVATELHEAMRAVHKAMRFSAPTLNDILGRLVAERIDEREPDRSKREAMRDVLAEHVNPHGYGYCPTCYDYVDEMPKEGCPTLLGLAAAYGVTADDVAGESE